MLHQRLPSLNRDPNVVPMIDLLLVLLIIFMLYAIQQRMALDLQLPQEVAGEGVGPSIVLDVLPGPRYALNRTAVAPEALAAELTRVFAGRPEKVLFVRGDRTVRYQDIVHAFDIARGAGVPVTGVVLRSP
jgi:biopolymer transport protein TolR